MMMASHGETEIERDEQQTLEGESDLDRMAQHVKVYLNLKILMIRWSLTHDRA